MQCLDATFTIWQQLTHSSQLLLWCEEIPSLHFICRVNNLLIDGFRFEQTACLAICGIDWLCGHPLFRQVFSDLLFLSFSVFASSLL